MKFITHASISTLYKSTQRHTHTYILFTDNQQIPVQGIRSRQHSITLKITSEFGYRPLYHVAPHFITIKGHIFNRVARRWRTDVDTVNYTRKRVLLQLIKVNAFLITGRGTLVKNADYSIKHSHRLYSYVRNARTHGLFWFWYCIVSSPSG